MKTYQNFRFIARQSSQKKTKPTKLTFMLVILFLLPIVPLFGQTNTVNLNIKDATIIEILRNLENQCNYGFIFKSEDLDIKKLHTVKLEQVSLSEALKTILKDENVDFKIENKNVIITKKSEQQRPKTITGKITDHGNIPIPGVSVMVRGTTKGCITDPDGNYLLNNVSSNDVLVFSFIGMKPQEVIVGNQLEISLQLQEEAIDLSEIVVIGYGVQKKEDATGAVDVITSKSFNKGITTSPTDLLNGKTAGVQITQNNGAPGSGSTVRIRGINSITGSSEPLYVIDGVPIDNNRTSVSTDDGTDNATSSLTIDPLSTIASEDIESITVLKDASATAIYGSRGANGVIIVTTKKGKEGSFNLSYNGSMGLSTVSKTIDLFDATGYINTIKNLANQVPLADDIQNYNGYVGGGANTDWQSEIFRTAISHKHDISFSSGVQKFNYRFSAGYLSQEGIVDNTDYGRLNARFNATQKMLNDKLKFDVSLSISDYEANNLPEQQTGGYEGGVLNNALKMDPTQPVFNDDGSFNEYAKDVRNPVALLHQTEDLSEGLRFIGSVQTTYNLTDNFFVKLNLAKDQDNSARKIYHQKASSLTDEGRAIREDLKAGNELMEVYLNYTKIFGSNQFSALAGHSYQKFYSDILGVVGTGFASDELGYNNLSADNLETTAFKETNKLSSFFVRVNFDLGNRFLWTGTLRADGSSKFAKDNRWGYFPSTALAWKVSNERFLKSFDALNSLKLRLGIGTTGNQNIGNNLYLSTLSLDGSGGYYFGDAYYAPISPTNIANPNLEWEKTTQSNIGIDFGLWESRLSGSIDYYYKKTTDLLVKVPAVQPAVASSYLDNIGEMVNKGIEFSANYTAISKKDLSLDLGFNISFNHNEVTKLYSSAEIYTGTISGSGAPSTGIQLIKEGFSYGTFYGYKYLGTNSSGQETFADANGEATTDINNAELQVIGEALPEVNYGFNVSIQYKKWFANVSLRGLAGNEVYNNTRAEIVQPDRLPGINTTEEAARFANASANEYRSSRWVEDGSFLRLDNTSIGYDFGQLGKVQNLRVYITGQNLFILTNYKGYDPEVNTEAGNSAAKSLGIDYTNYPKARTIMGGVSLNF